MQAFGDNQMRQLGWFGYNQAVKNQAVKNVQVFGCNQMRELGQFGYNQIIKNIQVNGLQTNHNLKGFGTNQLELIDDKLESKPTSR